jgi:hypothetical protein
MLLQPEPQRHQTVTITEHVPLKTRIVTLQQTAATHAASLRAGD